MQKTEIKQSKEKNAKWISGIVVLSLLSIALLIGMLVHIEQSGRYRDSLENVYQKSLMDVVADMNNIEVKLSKLLVVESQNQRAALSADIWRQSAETASNLASLPIEHNSISSTFTFVNQLGDYVNYINTKLSDGGEMTIEEEQTIETLHDRAIALRGSLRNMLEGLGDGYRITDNIKRKGPQIGNSDIVDGLKEFDANNADYPKLIYDGPFSDNVKSDVYRFLENKSETTKEQAYTWVNEHMSDIKSITYNGITKADADTHSFNVLLNDNSSVYIQLTVRGCYPINICSYRQVSAAGISKEDAIKSAQDYAASIFGLDNFSGVWYNADSQDNTAYVNLAPVIDDVVYYTDLVIVKVALDNGKVLGLESKAFLINHADKELEPIVLTAEQSKSLVSKKIVISGTRLAVIPKGKSGYVLCYENYGSYKGYDYMVYINVTTGEEEDVLRVIDSEQGSMLM